MKGFLASKKIFLIIFSIVLLLVLAIGLLMFYSNSKEETYGFTLNARDVALNVNDSVQLKVVPDDDQDEKLEVDVAWVSSDATVATVGEDGIVAAKNGGEAKITAIVKYKGKETSASCMVTVKSPELEYSTYKIRWYTQSKDRGSYQVTEESFERLIGSKAEITKEDAAKSLPDNYTLNLEKSILSGTVNERMGSCVLEVYYDVAKVPYSVDYYYESDTALGTYKLKESKNYEAYAFTKVTVPDDTETGFVLNSKVKDSVLENDSVVAGSKLKAYYDRVRSKVTISYVSGRETATYTNVYGVGLQGAPATALQDDLPLYDVTSYVNGVKKPATESLMKSLTTDTTVEFKVDGVGFTYVDGILYNTCETKNTSSYVYLRGASNVVYLSATYHTTGSQSNMFGITIRSGGTSRELRFQHQGFRIMKDHTSQAGTLLEENPAYGYNTAGRDQMPYIFAQNTNGATGTTRNSTIYNMVTNGEEGSYQIVWVIWEGTLYAMVDGEVSVALPLNLLDTTWTADKDYEIGFSTFDGLRIDDELFISDIEFALGDQAEAKLVTNKSIKTTSAKSMIYEPITGSYMPASSGGAGYVYGARTSENTGISADVKWVNKYNSASAAGVTVQVGDQSVQYVMEGSGSNTSVRRQADHRWNQVATISRTVLKYTETSPCAQDGSYQVTAMVKDGYFYVLYNDVEAICVNMQSLFDGYTPDMEASVGIYSWDACNGQSYFQNVTQLSKEDVDEKEVTQWSYYTDTPYVDDFDYVDGSVVKNTSASQNLVLMNGAKIWELEGVLTRPEAAGQEEGGLMFGFLISSGDRSVRILGQHRGFARALNGWYADSTTQTYDTGEKVNIYQYNGGTSIYAFNDITESFFSDYRTQTELPFKALIYNDVLYVWFDGEICWRVPLTEEAFGGFTAGSDYEVSVQLASGTQTGTIENLTLKMGYQVTQDKDFLTYDEKSYSVEEVTDIIDANVTRWSNFERIRITGAMAEDVTYTKEGGWGEAVLTGTEKVWQVEGNLIRDKQTFNHMGFIIKSGSNLFRIYGQHNGFRGVVNTDWNTPGFKYNGGNGTSTFTFGDKTYEFFAQDSASIRDTIPFRAVIYNDIFYLWLDGEIVWRVPLTEEEFGGFDQGSEYQLSISMGDTATTSAIENPKITTGDEVIAQSEFLTYENKTYTFEEAIATIDANVTRWSSVSKIRITGAMAENVAYTEEGGWGEAVLTGTEKVWQVEGDLIRDKQTFNHIGFIIKSGSNSLRIYGQHNGFRGVANGDWNTPGFKYNGGNGTSTFTFGDKTYEFFAQDSASIRDTIPFRAVIYNDIFYLWLDGEIVWRVPLTEKEFGGFGQGSEYQLSVSMGDTATTSAMENLKITTGDEVIAQSEFVTYENKTYTFEEAIATIDANISRWKDDGGLAKMCIVGVMGAELKTLGEGGAGYAYATEAVAGNQGIKATIQLDDITKTNISTGITLQHVSSGASAQILAESNNSVRIQFNHQWGTPIYVTSQIPDGLKEYKDGVCQITAVIKEDRLYVFYDGVQAGAADLVELLPEYKSGDAVRLGICSWDANLGTSRFTDVEFLTGEAVEEIQTSDTPAWTIR